jgi:hypothetical protein
MAGSQITKYTTCKYSVLVLTSAILIGLLTEMDCVTNAGGGGDVVGIESLDDHMTQI